jgi:hypothetical protein
MKYTPIPPEAIPDAKIPALRGGFAVRYMRLATIAANRRHEMNDAGRALVDDMLRRMRRDMETVR